MISTPSELNPSWWVVLLLMALTGLGAWVGIRVLDAIGRRC